MEVTVSEKWMTELLASARDIARSHEMHRLAEHLDDAILLAASEFHTAAAGGNAEGAIVLNERLGTEGIRDTSRTEIH